MLPTAGLFLPETLHRREASSRSDLDVTKLNFFSRHISRPKQEHRTSEISLSTTERLSQEEPTVLYPSIATAFDYADYVSTTNKATSESGALGCLIHRVRADVNEASRLYLSPAVNNFLEAWPDRRSWIDAILHDVRRTLNDIGAYIDSLPLVVDVVRKRLEWVLNHPKKLASKQQLLATCHQSLMSAVTMMQTAEICSVTNSIVQDPVFEAPVQPWVKREDSRLMRGPYSRRESRLSQKNLTSSNSNLSHSEMENTETGSLDSVPIELPGSTPDDLADPNNMDLYKISKKPDSVNETSLRRQSYGSTEQPVGPSSRRSSGASARSPRSRYSPLRPVHPASRRQSLDQIPSSKLVSTIGRSRGSFDTSRIRPESEPNLDTNTSTAVLVTGMMPMNALPALAETSLERNESTISNNTVFTIPRYARAHKPTSVYIKQSGRHRSLPTVLPPLQNQPTLAEDLADWIEPVSNSEKLPSTEWEAASAVSSAQMSEVSDAAITEESTHLNPPDLGKEKEPSLSDISIPDFEQDTSGHLQIDKIASQRRSDELFFNVAAPGMVIDTRENTERNILSAFEQERASSIRSVSSSIARKPLPASSTVSLNISPSTPSTSPTKTFVDSPIAQGCDQIEVHTSKEALPGVSTGDTSHTETTYSKCPPTSYTPDVSNLDASVATDPEQSNTDNKEEISPETANTPGTEQPTENATQEKSPIPDPSMKDETKSPDSDILSEATSPKLNKKRLQQSRRRFPYHADNIPLVPATDVPEADAPASPPRPTTVSTPTPKATIENITGKEIRNNMPSNASQVNSSPIPAAESPPTRSQTLPIPESLTPTTAPPEAPIPLPKAPAATKPMTAQAKRRAAHQRRMQLAFGGDV